MQFTVVLAADAATALKAVVSHHRARLHGWRSRQREHLPVNAVARRDVLADIEATVMEQRRLGEFLATASAVVDWHLRQVLADRGLDTELPPIPAGLASLPGRRWGVGSQGGNTVKICIALRDPITPIREGGQPSASLGIGEHLRRAAFWTSRPAEQHLQVWHDRFKRGSETPTAADVADQRRWRKQIVTTGDLIRASIDRATIGKWIR